MMYYKNYQNLPKKPVKTFQDLEVYQKALEANVFIATEIVRSFDGKSRRDRKKISARDKAKGEGNIGIETTIITTMVNCSCSIPHLIAEAHSFRFGSEQTCLVLLERVMLNCNKMVVYLEQVRDICETGIEWEKFDETIKKYMYIRRKVLNLQRSWKKFMRPAAEVDRG